MPPPNTSLESLKANNTLLESLKANNPATKTEATKITNQVLDPPDFKDQVRDVSVRRNEDEVDIQETVQQDVPNQIVVNDDADFIAIASALEIPDEAISEEIINNRKQKRAILMLSVCIIVLLIVVAVVGGICGSGKCGASTTEVSGSTTPTIAPSVASTTEVSGSTTPTIPPSSKPSVQIMMQLDDFTLNSGWNVFQHIRFLQDMNNDGIDDIVGFGDDGVSIALGGFDGLFEESQLVFDDFGFSQGWHIDEHPRFLADVDGDGNTDVVGFFDQGVYIARGNGEGMFSPIRLGIANYGTNLAWRVDRHPRFMADVNGDGKADIVGFGDYEVFVSLGQSDGTFDRTNVALLQSYCYFCAGNWRVEKHPRMIADVNGDSRADIVAFGDDGVYVALGQTNGTLADKGLVLPGVFGYNAGVWRIERHPILMADVNGDGKDDVVGFGYAGVFVALGQANGTFAFIDSVLEYFGYDDAAGKWRVENHPRMLVDVNADDKADIVGFGEDGVYVALGMDDGSFNYLGNVLNDFSIDQGWLVDNNPRLLGDINGDGMLDIVGFGNDFVKTALGSPDGTFS